MRLRTFILCCLVCFSSQLSLAKSIPCNVDTEPVVCAFLNRYLSELQNWHSKEVSLEQKMYDDKFVILDGNLDNISLFTDSTSFSLIRYADKAYEAQWNNGDVVLLRVGFPIQYDLLLGKNQQEIELCFYDDIHKTVARGDYSVDQSVKVDTVAPNLFRSVPIRHYQIPELTNCVYYTVDSLGFLQYVDDSCHIDYTLSNLFHNGLGRQSVMQISQKLYGFKEKQFSLSLNQWIAYCQENGIESYVAIEEQAENGVKVLVVAENVLLGYNHILSVFVPLESGTIPEKCIMLAKLNAFVPTHNIKSLYQEFTK